MYAAAKAKTSGLLRLPVSRTRTITSLTVGLGIAVGGLPLPDAEYTGQAVSHQDRQDLE